MLQSDLNQSQTSILPAISVRKATGTKMASSNRFSPMRDSPAGMTDKDEVEHSVSSGTISRLPSLPRETAIRLERPLCSTRLSGSHGHGVAINSDKGFASTAGRVFFF